MYAIEVTDEYPLKRDELAARLAEAESNRGHSSARSACSRSCYVSRVSPRPCPVAERLWETGLYLPSSISSPTRRSRRSRNGFAPSSLHEHILRVCMLVTTTWSIATSRTRTRRASWTRCCATRELLEAGCLTSRAARGGTQVEFAALGWDVTGVDLSDGAARASATERTHGPVRTAGHAGPGRERWAIQCRHLPLRLDRIRTGRRKRGGDARRSRLSLAPGGGARPRVPARAGTPARRVRAPSSPLRPLRSTATNSYASHVLDLTSNATSWRSSSSSSNCAPTAPTTAGSRRREIDSSPCPRCVRWLERAGFEVVRLVPAYQDGDRMDEETFHVIAVARRAG